MQKRLGFIGLLFAFITPLIQAQPVGMQQQKIAEEGPYRALETVVFYPAQVQAEASERLIADNPIFYGVKVFENAAVYPTKTRYPLVVISHGFGGNWTNQSWLAHALAQRGFMVVSLNHPGSSTRNVNPEQGAALWKRAWDIRHTLDQTLRNPLLAQAVDPNKVAIIGHSLGGWTAVSSIGGRMDTQRLADYCQRQPKVATCWTIRDLGVDLSANNQVNLGQDLRDPRIKAAVVMDLGGAQSFTPQSLRAIPVPTLVMVAEADPAMPIADESGYLKQQLPATQLRYLPVRHALHFTFLQRCKPGGAALLRQTVPEDEKVCFPETGQPDSRGLLHQTIIQDVSQFLQKQLKN